MMTIKNYIVPSMVLLSIGLVSFYQFEGISAPIACLFGSALFAIALIDAKHMIIPDLLSLPLIPLGLCATYLMTSGSDPNLVLVEHIMALLLAGAGFYLIRTLYKKMRGVEGLGLGDVKLIMVAGAWTGTLGVSYVVLLACIAAISFVTSVQIAAGSKLNAQSAIPFGTFLAPAIWLVWMLLQMSGNLNILF